MNCPCCNHEMSIGSAQTVDGFFEWECRCSCRIPIYPAHVIQEEEADRIGVIYGAEQSPTTHTATAKLYQEYKNV